MTDRFRLGLVPWVVFAIADRSGGHSVGWAAVLALVATAAIVGWPGAGPVTWLHRLAFATFGTLAAVGALLGEHELQRFGRAAAFAALAIATSVTGSRRPFVSPYLRELVTAAQAETPRYRSVCRSLAAIWATAFAAMTCSFLLAAAVPTTLTATIFNWLVPAALAVRTDHLVTARWEEHFGPEGSEGFDLRGFGDLF